MSYEEALAWLRGERSMANFWRSQRHMEGQEEVRLAQTDAAMTEQAYWIVRAHKEGLVSDGGEDRP